VALEVGRTPNNVKNHDFAEVSNLGARESESTDASEKRYSACVFSSFLSPFY